jgi:DUF1680 family protein
MLHMDPHNHRCCQHNFGHGWPYFAQHLWMATPGGGLAALFYSASKVTAKVGDGQEVVVEQTTRYPFEPNVQMVIHTEKAVRFPFYFRVPGWCRGATVSVNDRLCRVEAEAAKYLQVDREWKDGDRVSLYLPMRITVRTWQSRTAHVLAEDWREIRSRRRDRQVAGMGDSSDDAVELWPGDRSRSAGRFAQRKHASSR